MSSDELAARMSSRLGFARFGAACVGAGAPLFTFTSQNTTFGVGCNDSYFTPRVRH